MVRRGRGGGGGGEGKEEEKEKEKEEEGEGEGEGGYNRCYTRRATKFSFLGWKYPSTPYLPFPVDRNSCTFVEQNLSRFPSIVNGTSLDALFV